jgi:hypothetical protein
MLTFRYHRLLVELEISHRERRSGIAVRSCTRAAYLVAVSNTHDHKSMKSRAAINIESRSTSNTKRCKSGRNVPRLFYSRCSLARFPAPRKGGV